jgi:hypothetical protein
VSGNINLTWPRYANASALDSETTTRDGLMLFNTAAHGGVRWLPFRATDSALSLSRQVEKCAFWDSIIELALQI